MRLSHLLVPMVLAASGDWAHSQTPQRVPPPSNDLPTVTKPKPQPQKTQPAETPAEQPADPNAVPDPNVPEEEKPTADAAVAKDPRNRKKAPVKDDSVAAAQGGGASDSGGSDYTGPSILSRGMNFVRPAVPASEKFRPFAGVNFYHESGVTGPYQGPLVPVTDQGYTGLDFSFGISGQHSRRTDTIQLDYRGHVYVNGYSAQDHAVSLGYSRVLSRHVTVSVAETAGLYANNFAVLNAVAATDTSVANTALVVAPNTESFDDRTYYTTTQADLTYQKNARLSFNLGASGFYVKRESKNLISANGYQTRTDVSYRLTKRTTVGPYYAYSRYYYSGTFGDSDIHTVGLNYSVGITKRTQFRFRVGGTRLETRGLQVVVLDTAVAQILGFSTGIQRYYAVSYVPDFAADITRGFRRGDLTFSYAKGVSPGNGVILTSRRDSISGNYTYTGIREYAVTMGAGRDSLGSVSQQIGSYSSYFARLGLSHPLGHNLQGLASFDYRKLGFTGNVYARDQFRITLGLGFAPGYGPLKFW